MAEKHKISGYTLNLKIHKTKKSNTYKTYKTYKKFMSQFPLPWYREED